MGVSAILVSVRNTGSKSTMLSRLALRSGAFGPSPFKALAASSQSVRCMSVPAAGENATVANWVKANETYYGPERDHKNFPHASRPVNHPPVRMGIFPESWFQAFTTRLEFLAHTCLAQV